jgi:hypothetical protein
VQDFEDEHIAGKMSNIARQRGFRVGIGFFAILLISPFLLYYSYCWGLWDRQSLLLQHFFQCNCSPATERARCSKEVDVIVSACRNGGVRLSPSGRLLYVREKKSGLTSAYLLDLQTMKKTEVTDQPFSSFLTDDLWYIESGLESYIIDRTNGKQYLIERFRYSHPDEEINGETNLTLLAASLRQAEHVFLIGDSTGTIIALAADFRTFPDHNFTAKRFDVPDFKMERFLQENNVVYQMVLASFPHEAVSFDGRFIARDDGIYLVGTNQMIVKAPPSLLRGWIYDSTGAIYDAPIGRCLLQMGFPFADDISCTVRVPQPVIKIKVPEEYLLSPQTP